MSKRPIPHPILVTPRLRLRQFRAADAAAMHGCFSHPNAMRFWNRRRHTRHIETERAIREFVECKPCQYRFWAVADIVTDRCLGLVNYHDGQVRGKRVALGYMIDPAFHRRGFATEAVSALLDFCFGELGMRRVQAFIDPDNTASRRLVEKLGFLHEGVLQHDLRVGAAPHGDMLYAVLEGEWRRGRLT